MMVGQGIEKAHGDKRFLAVFGGVSESGLKDLKWNLRLFPLFLALLFLSVSSWGECSTTVVNLTSNQTNRPTCSSVEPWNCGWENSYCGSSGSVACQLGSNSFGHCEVTSRNCNAAGIPSYVYGRCTCVNCGNECEADSAKAGGIITECMLDPETGTYKQYVCPSDLNCSSCWKQNCTPITQDTATMELLTQACEELDGEPHYRYNDDGNVVGYCDICQTDEDGNYTNVHTQAMWEDYKQGCCETGHAPNKSNFKCLASQNGCYAADCDWTIDPTRKGGGIGYSETGLTSRTCEVSVTTNIDGVVQGCEDTPSSSDSQNSSSSGDSSGSSSSGEGSSASAEENLQTIADGVGAIIDSLHKIIVIDSMNRSYDSLVSVFVSEIATFTQQISENASGGGDTTIVNVNVPRDTNIVNVNVSTSAVVDAINDLKSMNLSMSDSTHKLLDSIFQTLSSFGTLNDGVVSTLDSIRADNNTIGDSTHYLLDSLAGLFGNMLDTSETPEGDTSGWGGWIDSVGSWLRDSTILSVLFGTDGAVCDTTDGKKCESMGGSLDSARDSWGTTYRALGDSLTEGAVGDSLAVWENKLLNNGVITGSGSNSCPSVFSRTYTLSIGSGVTVDVPALGQYVCATIPNTSVTFWTLARVLIRAMVAITCMWWLYRAVTGVTYDGGDDD